MLKTIQIFGASACLNPLSLKFPCPCRRCRIIVLSTSAAFWFVLKRPPGTKSRSTAVIVIPSAAAGSMKTESQPLAILITAINQAKVSFRSPMSIHRANTSFIRSFSSPVISLTHSNRSPAGTSVIQLIDGLAFGRFLFSRCHSIVPPFADKRPSLAQGYSLLRGNRV